MIYVPAQADCAHNQTSLLGVYTYVCMCVCMCAYIRVCVCLCVYVPTSTRASGSRKARTIRPICSVYIYMCAYVCAYVFISVCTFVCMCAYLDSSVGLAESAHNLPHLLGGEVLLSRIWL